MHTLTHTCTHLHTHTHTHTPVVTRVVCYNKNNFDKIGCYNNKENMVKILCKECDGVPIVVNAPGAAARLDTPVMFSTKLYYS